MTTTERAARFILGQPRVPGRAVRGVILAVFFLASMTANAANDPACTRGPANIFQEAAVSVVRVFSVAINAENGAQPVRIAVGTGFVIDEEGHIVTNAHVVVGANELMASGADARWIPAEVVGSDPVTDLAVIKTQTTAGSPLAIRRPKVRLGNSDAVRIGDEVLAIGYPYDIGMTASRGIVSGLKRHVSLLPMNWLTPLIQTDAAVNPGNSGGPLLDSCGNVIGLVSFSSYRGQGLAFATPINSVKENASQIIRNGRVARPWHGINGQVVPVFFYRTLGLPPGFLIETIEPGSPAEKLGLHGGTLPVAVGISRFLIGGDVITEVNGEKLDDPDTLAKVERSFAIGQTLRLKYWHAGTITEASVTLPERPILPSDIQRLHEHGMAP